MTKFEPAHKITYQEFLLKYGVEHSFLTVHNFGSRTLEYMEIGMPYMVIYESLDTKHDSAAMLEITESRHNHYFTSVNELLKSSPKSLHVHNFYEMTFVLSGEMKIQIENEIKTYHPGEFCFCNKNIKHAEIIDSDYEIVCLMFKEDYLQDILGNDIFYDTDGNPVTRKSFIMRLLSGNRQATYSSPKTYIDFTQKNDLTGTTDLNSSVQLINTIIKELNEKIPGSNYILKGLFCRLFYLLENNSSYVQCTHELPLQKDEKLFYRISSLLEETNGTISRKDIEKELNYNSDYMNRVVKQHTGMTLSEYSKIFLLQEAERLLKSTELSVAEICDQLGYSNHTYFNRIFTEKYHLTPKEYKRSLVDNNKHFNNDR